MTKENILNNVDSLDAQQLATFIKEGKVALNELRETGDLDNSKRRKIQEVLSKEERVYSEAWIKAKNGSDEILKQFIRANPDSKHAEEAAKIIRDREVKRASIEEEKYSILEDIKDNPNSKSVHEIIKYLEDGTITEEDLINHSNIPQSALDNLHKVNKPNLDKGSAPESIPDGYTELYFWGIPGSGKTTALGAILHMAEQNGYLNLLPSNGLAYATILKNMFSNDGIANDFMPATTNVEQTRYIPFTLNNKKKGERNVSLIELSGEVMESFYNMSAGEGFISTNHEIGFNQVLSYLESKNRKFHFFFVDYAKGNESDLINEKHSQNDYLAQTANYIKSENIFKNNSDSIYVVLTKSDLLRDEDNEPIFDKRKRTLAAVEYLNTVYPAFINNLKTVCKDNSINGGNLKVVPFSLGNVYFRDICNFDGSAANDIIDILLDRIVPKKKNFFDFFNK